MLLVRDEPFDLSAYWFGIIISTVLGRLKMIGSSARCSPTPRHRLANFQREIDLRGGEAFRRILEADFRAGTLLTFAP
jgi:hypothetical protein